LHKSNKSHIDPPFQQHRPSTLNPQNEVKNKCVTNQQTLVEASQNSVASRHNHVGNHQTEYMKSFFPEELEFCFKMTLDAAEKIFFILKHHNLDLGVAIKEAQSSLPVGFGSELRKPLIFLPILKNHLLWPKMKSILENGSQWPIKPITEKERTGNIVEAIKFGNHKRATSQPELLMELVLGDVKHGYTIPFPIDKATQIPHICMAPLNIQPQWTINELGKIVGKNCLTLNQSFQWKNSGTSVNLRCNLSKLQKYMYGKCLL
jgi:hypothetical protein